MSNANQQQDVSVLSSAKSGLVYLTANDWALIVDKAVRRPFKAGEQIVQMGKRTHGVYLLVKGTASVQIQAQGTILSISAGEVCGEISFLDELPATANVVANESVETYYLDRPTLQVVLAATLLSMLAAPLVLQRMDSIVLHLVESEWTERAVALHTLAVKSMATRGHVIVCGYGRSGQALAQFLEREKVPVIALDSDPERVRQAAAAGDSVVFGDGSRREVLVAAALSRATAVVVSFANTPALPPAIQPESLGDPIFVVPAGNLTPAPLDATFTPTFSVTITFNRKLGTTTQSAQTKTISISPGRTFERETNALRVYLVPMGDVSQPYNTQYTSTDQTIVQNAMQTFSRIYPVPAGIADLTATTGGVRYVVDTATILDLRSISGAYTTALGATRFCGTTLNFNAIKGLLAQYLLAHNTANPNATADRVVGVVGGNTTTGRISFGTEDSIGCADGMASASSAESWVRLTPDPSRTGALMAMEVTHTFGLERNPSYHSSAIEADAGTDRAYNVAGRNRILSDHTVMDYNNTGSSWGNDNTLFEASDFGSLLCQLKPTSAGTTACPTPGNIGTSTGVAAGEKYVIAGTSDGLPGSGHSKVIEPYYSVNVAETPSLNSSELRLIQLDRSVSPRFVPAARKRRFVGSPQHASARGNDAAGHYSRRAPFAAAKSAGIGGFSIATALF